MQFANRDYTFAWLKTSLFALALIGIGLSAQTIPVTERTLANGMRVILVERHNQPRIACAWVARVGSANETAGRTGLTHLFEHLMFKGTQKIGTRNPRRDAELNDLQDQVQAGIRAEMDVLRERQRRGEVADMNDPAVATERLNQLRKQFDDLVKEQHTITKKDEFFQVYAQYGGGDVNADTTTDRTQFQVTMPSNKLELWAWLESDRLKNAVFREFYSERDVVQAERLERTDATPTGPLLETFGAQIWLAMPYRWPVLGWPSDISQVTREQANDFFSTFYGPENISIILVGDFRTEDTLALVERYFGSIPVRNRTGVPKMITTEPTQLAENRVVGEVDSDPTFIVKFKTVPVVHKDSPALAMLSSILNGDTGRLNRELVLKRQVAVQATSASQLQKYSGIFLLGAAPCKDATPEQMEGLLYAEIEKIQKDGISDRELQRIKNHIEVSTYGRMESISNLRSELVEAESFGTYVDYLNWPKALQNVTKADVQRVARTYFNPQNRNVLIIHRKAAMAPEVGNRVKEGL